MNLNILYHPSFLHSILSFLPFFINSCIISIRLCYFLHCDPCLFFLYSFSFSLLVPFSCFLNVGRNFNTVASSFPPSFLLPSYIPSFLLSLHLFLLTSFLPFYLSFLYFFLYSFRPSFPLFFLSYPLSSFRCFFLPSLFSSILISFLPSFLPFCLPSLLPFFLASFLLSFLPFFLFPFYLTFFLPSSCSSLIPSLLSSLLSSLYVPFFFPSYLLLVYTLALTESPTQFQINIPLTLISSRSKGFRNIFNGQQWLLFHIPVCHFAWDLVRYDLSHCRRMSYLPRFVVMFKRHIVKTIHSLL